MPAAMHGHVVYSVRAKQLVPIFASFSPGWIISERRNHFDIVAVALQKFAKRNVVRRNSGDFRRVIDAPDDDSHRVG